MRRKLTRLDGARVRFPCGTVPRKVRSNGAPGGVHTPILCNWEEVTGNHYFTLGLKPLGQSTVSPSIRLGCPAPPPPREGSDGFTVLTGNNQKAKSAVLAQCKN